MHKPGHFAAASIVIIGGLGLWAVQTPRDDSSAAPHRYHSTEAREISPRSVNQFAAIRDATWQCGEVRSERHAHRFG